MKAIILAIILLASIQAQEKVKVPPKPVAIESEVSDEDKFLMLNRDLTKDNDEIFETFMLLNIYTEQRKTNRILNEIKEEEENEDR